MDDQALATKIGCPVEVLTLLRLCRMPASANPDFWRDVQKIANRFSVDADALAEIVRLGQSVVHLQATQGMKDHSAGFLMAARDDEPEASPPDQGDST